MIHWIDDKMRLHVSGSKSMRSMDSKDKAITLGHPSYVWRFGQDRRLDLIHHYAELTGKRILDVGCGLGAYVRKMGAFKPSNKTPIEGLNLAGGAAHPGPGMPMVLMSGWIAADTVDQDLRGIAGSAGSSKELRAA